MLKKSCFLLWAVLLSLPVHAESIDTEILPAAPPSGGSDLELYGESVAGAIVRAKIEVELPFRLGTGSAIAIGQHWTETDRLQTDSPGAVNYIQVNTGTYPEATLVARYIELDGLYGGLESPVPTVAFELTSGELDAGTILRFTTDRLQLPTTVVAEYQLPLFVRTDQNTPWVMIPGNSVQVGAADFSRLGLHASSVGQPGVAIDLWIRLEDEYGNLVRGRALSLDLLVNGVFRERVNVSNPVQRIENISLPSAGTYQLEVRTGGGGMSALSNPILIGQYPQSIIWADIGSPSSLSEGRSSPEGLVREAAGKFDLTLVADPGGIENIVDGIAIRSSSRPPAEGGSFITLRDENGVTVIIGRAENPTDLRRMLPDSFGLVEIVSGGAVYDWFGNQAAADGFPIGFIGSNHSHQYPGDRRQVNTAITLFRGETWFDALRNQQTYVSVGSRIVLVLSNKKLDLVPIRHLELEVAADSDIASIEVFKNGVIYKSKQDHDPLGNQFRLILGSPSTPAGRLMSRPRNAREWVGYISSRDAQLAVPPPPKPWQVRQARSGERVDFFSRTHGIEESLTFNLETVSAGTVIEVGIAPGYEDAAWLPADRMPAPTPAQKFLIPVEEARQGATRSFDVSGYRDTLRVEPAPKTMGPTARFEFDDPSSPRLGDYYYYRVRLIDGSFAYSSPIYVGDF